MIGSVPVLRFPSLLSYWSCSRDAWVRQAEWEQGAPPPLCQFAQAENPSCHQHLQSGSCNNPGSQDSKTCDSPALLYLAQAGGATKPHRGRPYPYQAGTWILVLVFKSLITQRTTTEFLQLLCPPVPVCKVGRDNAWVPPASKPKPVSHLVPEPGIQPTGKWAPKDVWTVVEGRVQKPFDRTEQQRPTPHSGSLLKNSLEML